MKLSKILFIFACFFLIFSCADYKSNKITQKEDKKYFSSKGFTLIYEDKLYKEKVILRKIDNSRIIIMHDTLKVKTPVKVINPDNSKSVEATIYKKLDYPKIFNSIISKKIATILELDLNNPYVEIVEIKKNKTFVAKKSNTFEEEKNVAESAPVDEIKMDDLSKDKKKVKIKNKSSKEKKFTILINNFYYEDSAINLQNELIKKINTDKFYIKKINNKKYSLLAGPFKNFNALKTTYIRLNNLGFEHLNIYKE